jgi:hypothetical protein
VVGNEFPGSLLDPGEALLQLAGLAVADRKIDDGQRGLMNIGEPWLRHGEPPSRGYLALPKNKISSVSRIAPLSGSVALATQI